MERLGEEIGGGKFSTVVVEMGEAGSRTADLARGCRKPVEGR